MKIGIVTSYFSEQPAGLERFLIDLLQELDRSVNVKYVVYTKKGAGLIDVLKKRGVLNIDVVEVGFGKIWKDLGLFFAPRADAYIFNGPIVPCFFAPKNYFVILHDFAYRHNELKTGREKIKRNIIDLLTRKALLRAKKIITVSEATKRDLLGLFDVKEEKVVTIYPGFKLLCDGAGSPFSKVDGKEYFLCLGTPKKRKNILSIVQAFSIYKRECQDDYKLLIVGKYDLLNPYIKNLIEVIEHNNLANDVIFTGHITDEQLSYIYQHATALIYPSMLEGFGFPILEAMSCRVPVVTSNISSLAEISGDAAIQIDPLDIVGMAGAMKQIVNDGELKAKLVSSGLKRSNIFSWSKTARELESLVRDNTVMEE